MPKQVLSTLTAVGVGLLGALVGFAASFSSTASTFYTLTRTLPCCDSIALVKVV
jgi:hypothetical protein